VAGLGARSVETASGRVRGRAGAYLGIPYAAPPTGPLRLRPPDRMEPWSGELDATRPGPPAPQPKRPISEFAHGPTPPASEDCLTLNVWTPTSGDGPWPVLVWAIGGGWTLGWAGSGIYDGAALAEGAEVVVVNFNYRLGSLGWLYHPDLGGGNWGLLDHVAALEWVRENIAAFGGDPDRVTMGGQSAGAANVADLLVCPAAEGLFWRAILHSPPLPEAANDPERGIRWADALAARVGPLREAPAERIVAEHEALLAEAHWRGSRGAAWPTLDSRTLPASPLDRPDARIDVPVLVGSTRDEATFLFRAGGRRAELDERGLRAVVSRINGVGDVDAVIERHRDADPEATLVRAVTAELFTCPMQRWARERAARGGSVHLFRIDHPAPDPRLGALHTIDVPLLFGTFRTSDVGRNFAADDEATRAVSAWMQREWAQFLHGDAPGWPQLDPQDGAPHLIAIGDT
jgi:para-nitrobenzyl esterase